MDNHNKYISYEYKTISCYDDLDLQYIDSLNCFGWKIDQEKTTQGKDGSTYYVLKRLRHIVNKTELTRLERNLYSCIKEIDKLNSSIHNHATMIALIIAFIGTAFITGATFAVISDPPHIKLCVILAIPGFIGWTLPYFAYKKCKIEREKKIAIFIEKKQDEIDHICEKALQLTKNI